MPACLKCGNTQNFTSSYIAPEVPYTNPPLPLHANFHPSGEVKSIEYAGSDQHIQELAWQKPQKYFDTCALCGSHQIDW